MSDYEALHELLKSDEWPNAVPASLLCDAASEQAKMARGRGILDVMIDESVSNRKFLDFGCGEGHCAAAAREQQARLAVGYDITRHPSSPSHWGSDNGALLLTTSFEAVRENGPYDLVLVYDVLDHLERDSVADVLRMLRQVTAAGSRIYVRCHPWRSRHGGHLYQTLNKAFAHLVFTSEELSRIGCAAPPRRHSGLADYASWFRPAARLAWPPVSARLYPTLWLEAAADNARLLGRRLRTFATPAVGSRGFRTFREQLHRNRVEPFFFQKRGIFERLSSDFGLSRYSRYLMEKELEISFADYAIAVD